MTPGCRTWPEAPGLLAVRIEANKQASQRACNMFWCHWATCRVLVNGHHVWLCHVNYSGRSWAVSFSIPVVLTTLQNIGRRVHHVGLMLNVILRGNIIDATAVQGGRRVSKVTQLPKALLSKGEGCGFDILFWLKKILRIFYYNKNNGKRSAF